MNRMLVYVPTFFFIAAAIAGCDKEEVKAVSSVQPVISPQEVTAKHENATVRDVTPYIVKSPENTLPSAEGKKEVIESRIEDPSTQKPQVFGGAQ